MNDDQILVKFCYFRKMAFTEWLYFFKTNKRIYWERCKIYTTWKQFFFNLLTKQITYKGVTK